jgi:hypothetical protein
MVQRSDKMAVWFKSTCVNLVPNNSMTRLTLQWLGFVFHLSKLSAALNFRNILRGNSLIYQLMPKLNLMEIEDAIAILQVLKAICKL